MANDFNDIHFHVTTESDQAVEAVGSRPMALRGAPRATRGESAFTNDEAAARSFLSKIFQRDDRPTVRGLTAPSRPEVVPDMRLRDSQPSPITNTTVVRFVQTKSSIPIFGTRAMVEMDANRELVAIDASVADVGRVSPVAALSPAHAIKAVADATGVSLDQLQNIAPPELTFFQDDEKKWHLAYHLKNVPAAPADFIAGTRSHGVGRSIAQRHPELDYLVDAHDGNISLYWSSMPTVAPDVPVDCEGADEEDVVQKFWGREVAAGNGFELSDPLRGIKTCDFGMKDIDKDPPPGGAISGNSRIFGAKGAVSAHFHAKRVDDFLRSVLVRDGIDDKGMELISYVNCTSPADQPPPEWHNAAWWKQRMWYGQSKDPATGRLKSFARHLDIIAHELAHGVTEFTAGLIYHKQSGALNESFSDILGVIIKNWDWGRPDTGGTVGNWDWELGSGLGKNGLPLRDMKDPKRTGDPDHMNDYLNTAEDNGGVHTNSNIHNKAAYNVLTAVDAQQQWVFTPREVAVLYYLALTRLDKIATFVQARNALLSVAGTYFSGHVKRQEKLDAINKAYVNVGIV